MKAPNIWTLRDLIDHHHNVSVEIDGKWVPARPLGLYRLRAAWLVFTGRADAVSWPGGQ